MKAALKRVFNPTAWAQAKRSTPLEQHWASPRFMTMLQTLGKKNVQDIHGMGDVSNILWPGRSCEALQYMNTSVDEQHTREWGLV